MTSEQETIHGASRWRTLIRVIDIEATEEGKKIIRAIVPGWDSATEVTFPLEIVPKDLWEKFLPNARFHAIVNLAAEDGADLHPDNFEICLPPNPKDGSG